MCALRKGLAAAAEGLHDDRIAGRVMEDYRVITEVADEEFAELESAVDEAVVAQNSVIRNRQDALHDHYPFVWAGAALEYRGSSTLTYEFLLAISQAKSLTKGSAAKLPRVFEKLVGQAVAAFLGPGTEFYRLGWPPDGDRPTFLREAVEQLHQKTGEWRWNPLPEHEKHQGPVSVKDGGIDLVVWKQFGDRRISSIQLLGQCACGDDWERKRSDLRPESFQGKWLRMLSHSGQLRFMAIPHHVPDEHLWTESCHSDQAGIFLDRMRITLLAEHAAYRTFWKDNPRDILLLLIRQEVPDFMPRD